VQKNSFGVAVVLSLMALRVGIGMHFFREGVTKARNPKPFSGAFFGGAKGPLAESYHTLVWDRDGVARLDSDKALKEWGHFKAQVENHYGFDQKQKDLADRVQKRSEAQLKEHFEENADDINEYRKGLARRDRYKGDAQRMETPGLRKQIDTIERELSAKKSKLVAPIDLMWDGYVRDLNSLANKDQRRKGYMSLEKPGRRFYDSETIDKFIPWFDMTLGVMLIAGLGARYAAIAAAAFLCSVMASQWPTTADSIVTWPQFIEVLGLAVVAATNAGRFAGVDGLLCGCCKRTAVSRTTTQVSGTTK